MVKIVTLEGLPMIAECEFIAGHGAEQCGFAIGLYHESFLEREFNLKKVTNTLKMISSQLPGRQSCRCSGYESQLRGIMDYFEYR